MDSLTLVHDRKRLTKTRIYRCLYDSPVPLSKQELSQRLSLSLPTVYQNIAELSELGLIEYTGAQLSRGGRPAMQLCVVSNARIAIGIYISMHRIYFSHTNLKCEVLGAGDVYHPYGLFTPEFNAFLAQELEKYIDRNHIDREKLLGVGICLSGIITTEEDEITVYYAPTLGLRNVSMRELISCIPYPVHAENDATSGGFTEWFNTVNERCLAFLSLANGVGGSIFVNGYKYLGTNQRSGEFGHMCVENNGLQCTCGKRGCLEAYCSASRISTDLGISPEEFFKRLTDGEAAAVALWDDYLHHLAIGVHNIHMAMDCQVIIGGMMAEYLPAFLPRLRSLVAARDPFSDNADYVSISRYAGKGPILGTALHFVEAFLKNNT